MIFGSLFSGGGGGDHGLVRAGMTPAFGCEIDPRARAVLRRNHPGIHIYHDVREVTREQLIADGIPLPKLIFGGSPCQDLSVAGKRAGLAGERSGLFHEQCRIADDVGADWVVWENVVGAFSSNKGEDFAVVLGGLTGHEPDVPAKGWRSAGICVGPKRVAVWRVLDAQAFGVPQRRRRVFVVAGPRAVARRLVELLFESEGSGGDLATSREERSPVAGATQWRAATSSTGTPTGVVQCLTTKGGNRLNVYEESYILETLGTNMPTSEVVGTLAPGAHGAGPRSVNGQDAYSGQLIPVFVYSGLATQPETAAPLMANAKGQRTGDFEGGTYIVNRPTIYQESQSGTFEHDTSGTLRAGKHNFQVTIQNAVNVAENQRNEVRLSTVASCLAQGGGRMGNGKNVVMYDEPVADAPLGSFTNDGSNIVVRRLTPLECERLMGWGDNWTAEGIDDDGNLITIPATQRYRICGNGIVANVTDWLGQRVMRAEASHD